MKNGSLTATLILRNSVSVPVNLPKSSFKKNQFDPKVMLYLMEFWRCDSLGVCSKRVCSRLGSLFSTTGTSTWHFRTRYPALAKRNRVLLQQDNARPHTAWTNMTKIQELGGNELLPHPAYSPNLVPSDYLLFWSMAHFLCGGKFKNNEAVEVDYTKFFASKTRDWFHCRIINLAERWLKTIESEGL